MDKKYDIRNDIFETIIDKYYDAKLIAEDNGVISGSEAALDRLKSLGIEILFMVNEGSIVNKGEVVAHIRATPELLAKAEEFLAGKFSKTSGIATAAYKASQIAKGRIKIVCGSIKKIPEECKFIYRKAIETGGISSRICDTPFLYLDKNYIKMFGGIPQTLKAVKKFEGFKKVIQIHNTMTSVEEEVEQAVTYGADILMIDTGIDDDIDKCFSVLKELNVNDKIVAFSGNVKLDRIEFYIDKRVDILCIGKEIIDARMLDMRFDVF
ncbi:MAG TPA: quinolinate phosphoribosyl transferase [Tissierellia bacterium]|nr:quinolinate phosphoribosyl transferase [Tissierellia bacterium]